MSSFICTYTPNETFLDYFFCGGVEKVAHRGANPQQEEEEQIHAGRYYMYRDDWKNTQRAEGRQI